MLDQLQEQVEAKPQVSTYVILAKAGLWLSSFVLAVVIVAGVITFYKHHSDPNQTAVAAVVVQACQVLAIVSVSVLGWHGYKGEHLLHTLRHWNDVNPPETKA